MSVVAVDNNRDNKWGWRLLRGSWGLHNDLRLLNDWGLHERLLGDWLWLRLYLYLLLLKHLNIIDLLLTSSDVKHLRGAGASHFI